MEEMWVSVWKEKLTFFIRKVYNSVKLNLINN